jgi:hypothetical protein
MFSISSRRWLALAALFAATAAGAQQAQQAPPTGPKYQSAFQDYQPYSDEKALPWKEANDTVRQIGGWREYAREAAGAKKPHAQPPVSTPAGAAGPASSSSDMHQGHHAPQPGVKP